jgi:lipopolysaccharide transport system ATP-binding protein
VTPAIAVEHLAKRYRIGARPLAYRTLRDAIAGSVRRRRDDGPSGTIRALDDVSFEIPSGEAIGIVGSNGAGKTTLLKILSRITEPTSGEARVRGRVGSLLEVGTGFHPELTGRENVYLNGAILGMQRREIAQRFDEIVDFAGVERFIDTPVKRYSSGMYVRLAFSVAAHLEADILLVDEVLSVGDLAFQRKCLGKMQDQTENEGRTVVFVSHNLASIKRLTERCVWLDGGRVRDVGQTDTVLRDYMLSHATGLGSGRVDLSNLEEGRPPSKQFERKVTFESVELVGSDGRRSDAHLEGEPITVRILMRCREPFADPGLEVLSRIRTLEGGFVFAALGGQREVSLSEGVYETSFTIDPNPLRPGVYQAELYCLTRTAQDLVPAAITFRIEPNPQPGDDPRYAGALDLGVVRAEFPWKPIVPAREPVAS